MIISPSRAEQLYARAAAAGHVQAADTYGLMLFQDGRRQEALPFVEDAARRGDPRSQYLLGIAHFNGDIVAQDWVRAYALVTLANSAALPQAAGALAEMDRHIPLEQRQQAAGLALQLRSQADAARATELAAADLASRGPGPEFAAPVSNRVPRPIPTVAVSPSIAAARTAVAEASRATGTESPAEAGAPYARAAAPPRFAVPSRLPATAPVVVAEAAPLAAASATVAGPWRVQLGAFSVTNNAQALWGRLSGRTELAGRERLMVVAGRVTKLQAGGYPSRAAADAACRSLRQAGEDCLVTDR